jgi:hypothetical protein
LIESRNRLRVYALRVEAVAPQVRLAMNAVLVPDREKSASREPQSLSELRRADELTRVVAAANDRIAHS